jgi:hypothetical protein
MAEAGASGMRIDGGTLVIGGMSIPLDKVASVSVSEWRRPDDAKPAIGLVLIVAGAGLCLTGLFFTVAVPLAPQRPESMAAALAISVACLVVAAVGFFVARWGLILLPGDRSPCLYITPTGGSPMCILYPHATYAARDRDTIMGAIERARVPQVDARSIHIHSHQLPPNSSR